MNSKAIKFLVLLLAFIFVAASCGGCKKDGPTTTPTELGPPKLDGLPEMSAIFKEDPEYLEFMDDISPITITIFYNSVWADGWKPWGENPVEQHITELTGVTLEGLYSDDAEGNTLTLMLASKEQLPDLLQSLEYSSVQFRELKEGNAIYKLNELIDQYCPLMWPLLNPVTKARTDENGDLWTIPSGATNTQAVQLYPASNGGWAVRMDVVEALGNPPLMTLDDMWAFLEMFNENKEKWPEIKYPFSFPALSVTYGNGRPFYWSYGGNAHLYEWVFNMVYNNETDTVHYWIEDDYGYKAVKEMFKLAQAGFVTEESFAITDRGDEVIAGSMLFYTGDNVWQCMYNDQLAENVPGARYERIAPISYSKNVSAGAFGGISAADYNNGILISKACKNPERTIKFLEFMQTDYAGALVFAGIYGTHWEFAVRDAELGTTYPNYIGEALEAKTMDGRFALGIYNHWRTFLGVPSDYDYWTAGESLQSQPDVLLASSFFKVDYYDWAPSFCMDDVPSEDPMALLRKQLETIIGTYQTRMILAANEAEFDSLYQELLTTLKAQGLQDLKDFVLPRVHDLIEQKEAMGVVWQ